MTQRFFYTDPLAAAWMAQHFRMKFEGIEITFLDQNRGLPTIEVIEVIDAPGCLVHLDSLHLLEPQAGDCVEFDRWYWDRQRDDIYKDYPYKAHFGSVHTQGKDDEWLCVSTAGVGWDQAKKGNRFSLPIKIIQRNGIAFMWPESQGAS